MHYAVRANAVDSLKVLLKMGASVTAKDFKGRDALFVAVEQGNTAAVVVVASILIHFFLRLTPSTCTPPQCPRPPSPIVHHSSAVNATSYLLGVLSF